MGKIVSLAWLPREFIRERVCTKIEAARKSKAERWKARKIKKRRREKRKRKGATWLQRIFRNIASSFSRQCLRSSWLPRRRNCKAHLAIASWHRIIGNIGSSHRVDPALIFIRSGRINIPTVSWVWDSRTVIRRLVIKQRAFLTWLVQRMRLHLVFLLNTPSVKMQIGANSAS